MAGKAVISLSTGLEDPEKVTVAFLVAVGAAGSGRRFMVCPVSSTPSSSTRAACCPTPNWPAASSCGSGSATRERQP